MTYDFSSPFTSADGSPIGDKSMAAALAQVCFAAQTIGGSPMKAEQKYMAYKLSRKLDAGAIDITIDEAQLLKQLAAEAFAAGLYGQVADILENK